MKNTLHISRKKFCDLGSDTLSIGDTVVIEDHPLLVAAHITKIATGFRIRVFPAGIDQDPIYMTKLYITAILLAAQRSSTKDDRVETAETSNAIDFGLPALRDGQQVYDALSTKYELIRKKGVDLIYQLARGI